ncbi:MAG TPA: short-chain dehydrogenase [Chloroflexi bacterium]|nr:short-chain dehydrogenase [Chloroflexota bacterium]|tara:strand:- start:395 stop:1192 length:798 start_codon:yes stop_codon:yes gene_type:complete
MDLNLKDKVVLVTGGSKGIGKAIALNLSKEGVKLAICARGQDLLDTTASFIEKETSNEVLPVTADLTNPDDVKTMVDKIITHYGRIDILVNNAGSSPGGVLENLTEEDWAQSLQLKFMGYVRCCKEVIPHMRNQGGGRVVNIIGNDGVKFSYWEITPGAANAAGQNFTLSLAGQYGKNNITFVAINPGPVATERWDGLLEAMARDRNISKDEADRLSKASIPLGRICTPQEVADLATFMASDRAHFINGTMIEIDGGQRKAIMDT